MYCADRLNDFIGCIKTNKEDDFPDEYYKKIIDDERTPKSFIFMLFKTIVEHENFSNMRFSIPLCLVRRMSRMESLPKWVLTLMAQYADENPWLKSRFKTEILVREKKIDSFIESNEIDQEILSEIVRHPLVTEEQLLFLAKKHPETVEIIFTRCFDGQEDSFNRIISNMFSKIKNEERLFFSKNINALFKLVQNPHLNEENYQKVMKFLEDNRNTLGKIQVFPHELIEKESTPDWLIEQIFRGENSYNILTDREFILQRINIPKSIVGEVVNGWRKNKVEYKVLMQVLIENRKFKFSQEFLIEFHQYIMYIVKSRYAKSEFHELQSYNFLHGFYSRTDIPESFFDEIHSWVQSVEQNKEFLNKRKELQHLIVAYGPESLAIPMIQEKMGQPLNLENKVFFSYAMGRKDLPEFVIKYLLENRHEILDDSLYSFIFYENYDYYVMSKIMEEQGKFIEKDLNRFSNDFNFFETEERKLFFVFMLTTIFEHLEFNKIQSNLYVIDTWLSYMPNDTKPLFTASLVDKILSYVEQHPDNDRLISIASKVIGKSEPPLSILLRLACHECRPLRWAALEHPCIQKIPLFKQNDDILFDGLMNDDLSIATQVSAGDCLTPNQKLQVSSLVGRNLLS